MAKEIARRKRCNALGLWNVIVCEALIGHTTSVPSPHNRTARRTVPWTHNAPFLTRRNAEGLAKQQLVPPARKSSASASELLSPMATPLGSQTIADKDVRMVGGPQK